MSKIATQAEVLLKYETLLRMLAVMAAGERVCVHCGCSDSRACPGGCAWVVVHTATPTGICTQCVEKEIRLWKKAMTKKTKRPLR